MEYARGIELFDYIAKKKRIDELTACHIYQQIISGLEYLHKNNIVHRDIKPENLIINKKTKELKIVDFGLSNMFNTEKRLLSSSCGSPSYAAPEMLQGKVEEVLIKELKNKIVEENNIKTNENKQNNEEYNIGKND